LIKQLSLGNENSGTGIRKVEGLKKVFEALAKKGARLYFQRKGGKIEILAISDKSNQRAVIKFLQEIYD
jgi:hypothetical protein